MAQLDHVDDVQSLSHINNGEPSTFENDGETIPEFTETGNDPRANHNPSCIDVKNLTEGEQKEMWSFRSDGFIPEQDIPSIDRRLTGSLKIKENDWTSHPPGINISFPTPNPTEPIKVMLVGVGGVGKSTLGSLLVGKPIFKSSDKVNAETRKVERANFEYKDQQIAVFDTPGYVVQEIIETRATNDESRNKLGQAHNAIEKGLKKLEDGVHVIAFVMSAGNDRKYEEHTKILQKAMILNDETFNHCMIVVTHAECTYLAKGRQNLLQNISQNQTIIHLLEDIKERIVLVEMGTRSSLSVETVFHHTYECQHKQIREMVLSMVSKVVADNREAGNAILYPIEAMMDDLKKARQRIASISPSETPVPHGPTDLFSGAVKKKPGGGYKLHAEFDQEECFPSKAKVYTPKGSKVMKELCLNDKILLVNESGLLEYEPVIMFSHATRDIQSTFISITTEHGKVLRLTSHHLLPIGELGTLKVASEVIVGDVVFAVGNDQSMPEKVVAVGVEQLYGLYCPHTPSGSIVVDGIVASCYTDIVPTVVAHGALLPVRVLHRILPTEWFAWLHEHSSAQRLLSNLRSVASVWQ